MGGLGSGPPRRYVGTVSQVTRMDAVGMARRGLFANGPAMDLPLLGLTFQSEPGGLRVSRLGNLGDAHRLPVEWTPCRFGGSRPWWRCPGCGRRCASLFLVRGLFRCRKCGRLTYSSRRQDASGRAWLRQAKAWRRLGHPDPHDTPDLRELPFAKPKGMHWRTFSRLADTIDEAEEVRAAALIRAAGRLFDRR